MSGARLIEVEGWQVCLLDFSHCSVEEAPALLEQAGALVRAQPLGSALTLSDFTDSRFDSRVTALLQDYTKANAPFVRYGAVVGVTGLKRVVYRTVLLFSGRTNIVLCDTLEAALRSLVDRARRHPR